MLLPVDKADAKSINKVQSLVVALLWLLKTRHDIVFATNLLARFTLTSTPMRSLRYLKGTIEYGVVFLAGFAEDGVISGQADADFAMEI